MGAKIDENRILNNEPYQSIINLLRVFKEGLELKRIQYAITEDHHLSWKTTRHFDDAFKDTIQNLIDYGYIRKYSKKNIDRIHKVRNRSDDPSYMEGKRNSNNLRNSLNRMMRPPNNVIYLENGKYKLRDAYIDVILPVNDRGMIEQFGKNIRSYDEGKTNLYGLQNLHDYYFDSIDNEVKVVIPEEIKEKIDNAVAKLREGINELQKINDYTLGWSLSNDSSIAFLKEKKYPLLDRQLLSIYRSFLFESSEYVLSQKVHDWFPYNVRDPLVVHPDDELIDLVKTNFYPSESYEEIKSRLDGHIICDNVASCFGTDYLNKMQTLIGSHIIAVVHSNDGTSIRNNLKESIKDVIEPSGCCNDLLNKYVETSDDKLQDIVGKSKLKKKIDQCKPIPVNDLINFHKRIMGS